MYYCFSADPAGFIADQTAISMTLDKPIDTCCLNSSQFFLKFKI